MSRLDDLLERACASFEARFGRPPEIAAAAPGRVNLIGEHTDYNGGFVLPMAIDRWTVALAAAGQPDQQAARIWAPNLNRICEVDVSRKRTPEGRKPPRFARYVLETMRWVKQPRIDVARADVAIASTLPIGSGLASSAAMIVALLNLLRAPGHENRRADAYSIAVRCQRIEKYCGTPCGIMDPAIIGFGRRNCALLIDCENPIPTDLDYIELPDDLSILVAETGVRRELPSSEYALRRQTCEAAAETLGVKSLRHVNEEMIRSAGGNLSEVERNRALHVVQENDRVKKFAIVLRQGNYESLGDLLFASHDSLRDLYEVSCPELDRIVDAARLMREEGEAVIGARMTGGGFGGCAIVLCERTREDAIIERLRRVAANVWPARAVDGAAFIPLA